MKKVFVTICLVCVVFGVMSVSGCGSSTELSFSGYTEKIQAGSPQNPKMDVIGFGINKQF